jgi:hypothetical protein
MVTKNKIRNSDMKLANRYPEKYNVTLHDKSEGDLRYSLRRKVIDVIYDTNRKLQALGMSRLPRIEVRIVKSADYAGMAYTGNKIIHITESAVNYQTAKQRLVIWHEIVHGLGWGHVEGCKLMDSNPWRLWSNGVTEEEVWHTFLEYVAEYQQKN